MTKEIHFAKQNPIPPVTLYASPKILADLRSAIAQFKSVDAAGLTKVSLKINNLLSESRKYRSVYAERYESGSGFIIFDLENPLVPLLREAQEAESLPMLEWVEEALALPRTLRVEVPLSRIKAITEPVHAAVSSIAV